MSRKWYLLVAVALCLPAAWWVAQRLGSRILTVTPPTEGISRTLASERAANIRSVRYALTLAIPPRVQDPIKGSLTIRLQLLDRMPLILDFAQPASHVSSIAANGQPQPVRSEQGHLVIPSMRCASGENTIDISFTAGDEALNRNDEYLYSLFVPARASQAFPCFDQPDIKAVALAHARDPVWMGCRRQRTGNRPRRRTETERQSVLARRRRCPLTCSDLLQANSRSSAASETDDRFTCITARPTQKRSPPTAKRSSICTSRRSSGSKTTRTANTPSRSSISCCCRLFSSRAWSTPALSITARRRCFWTRRPRSASISGEPA